MTRISLPGRTDELFGVKDENLRSLEEILKVRIKNDGADLIIETLAEIDLGGLSSLHRATHARRKALGDQGTGNQGRGKQVGP